MVEQKTTTAGQTELLTTTVKQTPTKVRLIGMKSTRARQTEPEENNEAVTKPREVRICRDSTGRELKGDLCSRQYKQGTHRLKPTQD